MPNSAEISKLMSVYGEAYGVYMQRIDHNLNTLASIAAKDLEKILKEISVDLEDKFEPYNKRGLGCDVLSKEIHIDDHSPTSGHIVTLPARVPGQDELNESLQRRMLRRSSNNNSKYRGGW